MTDKQIIIDGVDVSGCQYYKIPQNEMYPMSNFCDLPYIGFCKNDPKCSYKQWKRKEQECERLGYEIGSLENDRDILQEQLDQLKAENKHLSEKEEEARHYLEEAEKFKNYLTEIKEIVFPKNQLIITDSPIILKIQEKISEVLE